MILFKGGPIHTLAGGHADWVLVDGGAIASAGAGDPPPADETIDLDGATLVPAFCDAHVHLPATGLYAAGLDFRDVRSADTILSAFAERASSGTGVLFGGNFEDPLDRPLLASDLDRAVGDAPALLARADMHSCIVSSRLLLALELEGIEGVDRDADGQPTGYLREQAAAQAWRWFDDNLPERQQHEAIDGAARLAYSRGVASVHEMFVVEWRGWASYDVFRAAIEPLALNVVTYLGTDEVEKVLGFGHDRIGGDYFLDGAFGSHTAWMKEPFFSPPPSGSSPHGISYRDDDDLLAFFSAAQGAGLQVGVHAIGDAAIEQAIATWERVAADVGREAVIAFGHRIEHFECASDDHIARAASLGLRASVQPAFDRLWGGDSGLYAERIGWDRARDMNRFTSMRRALSIGAGSDSTVTPLDPFVQMASLRAHHVPDECMGAQDALRAHTVDGHALADDSTRGTLAVGKVADLAVLDRDPLDVDPDELLKTEVLSTWIAGEQVWP